MPASSSPEAPTHAGGVVYRIAAGQPEFLLVTARQQPGQWVLPKGHIERGERPEDAAVREVAEEAGVVAAVERSLAPIVIRPGGDEQRIQFFLMRAVRDGLRRERRQVVWLPLDETIDRLPFEESRRLVLAASELLQESR